MYALSAGRTESCLLDEKPVRLAVYRPHLAAAEDNSIISFCGPMSVEGGNAMKKKYGIQNEISVTTQHPDYRTEIADILRSSLTPRIKQERLLTYHARDLADALEILTPEERGSLYRILDPETLADIFDYAGDEMKYLKEISLPKRISVLSRFEADEMAEYIRDMDKEDRMAVIELLEDDLRKQVLLLHSFSEDEIGSKMTTNYIAVPSGISVRQAMRMLGVGLKLHQVNNVDNADLRSG